MRKQLIDVGQKRLLQAFLFVVLCSPAALASKSYDLLVQGALDGELQPLLSALENKRVVQLHAWTFWTGRIAGRSVVIGSGVRLERWEPLHNRLRIDGDKSVTFTSFPGDARLAQVAMRVPYTRGRVVAGNIGSALRFGRELDLIDWVRQKYGTDSEDMESAYAAGVATAMHVPFLAIRIISNTEWEHPTYERIAGQYCAEFVLAFVRVLPADELRRRS